MNQASDVPNVLVLGDFDWELEAAPTLELQKYDIFVNWMLHSPSDTSFDLDTLPEELKSAFKDADVAFSSEEINKTTFNLMRASVEADLEAAIDDISISRRQKSNLLEQINTLEGDIQVLSEQIALSEARISKHLQDRDVAISERYLVEKEIEEIEASDAEIKSMKNMDIDKLQREIAAVKVEAAQIQTELDKQYNHLVKQEKECVEMKLEIAKAKEFEDNFRVRIANAKSALQKPQKMRFFGAAAAVAFTRRHKSARCPQPL